VLVSPGHRFWPVGEAAQADYEALRAQVLTMMTLAEIPQSRSAKFPTLGTKGMVGL
jgi:hypothetical protein